MCSDGPRFADRRAEAAVRVPIQKALECRGLTRFVGICGSVILMATCASIPVSVQLIPEDRTTLHIGEIGAFKHSVESTLLGWFSANVVSITARWEPWLRTDNHPAARLG